MPDIVLIGAGIMSATLGTLLQELDPTLSIEVFERLDTAAAESSDAWNNAGTGHSAFCELNYTPQRPDGSVDTSKAVTVASSFEASKQFWASLVEEGVLTPDFIRPIPHSSFVWGAENVRYLKARHAALTALPLFEGMDYTEDRDTLERWMPLVMEGRDAETPVAATKMDLGTDVDFGALTRALFRRMQDRGAVVHFAHEVRDLYRGDDAATPEPEKWRIRVKDLHTEQSRTLHARFVFIGAGGGALHLLQKADIPEGKHFGGFPVSGQWLRCTNPAVIARHHAKVYGKASVGAPPMSVPHLDTRSIGGEPALLFGPYAGFSTKFLKQGSWWDLPKSIRLSNLVPMIAAGWHNIPLTKYLIQQVSQSDEDRLAALREYYPEAKAEDWELEIAGQRVQVIKADEEEGGVLEFGTEVVAAADGSLAALLGASPGASTAVSIMLGLLEKCFPAELAGGWREKLRQLIPSYGQDLSKDAALLHAVRQRTTAVLQLQAPANAGSAPRSTAEHRS